MTPSTGLSLQMKNIHKGGRGVTLTYFGYIGGADSFGVKILNFGIFGGFSENMNIYLV